ncbi:centromere protein J-like isoform X1 [Hoplias malabaricus]|uniref:centromere protein J-like isoform X1 n=1 Tax=Hoplias malabaricus TaxID=27720 RepID=UPI0034621727
MSSPAGPQPSQSQALTQSLPQSQFLSRWMANNSRAGVFLSSSPATASSVLSSCSSVAQSHSVDDSFCSQFAPLPMSPSSSLDSVVPEGSERRSEIQPANSELDTVHNVLRKVQGLPLMAKLEQLKQLQQRMQEQLKAHQLEQLQKLQNEQSLLGMVKNGTAEYSQEKEAQRRSPSVLHSPQTMATYSNTQNNVPWAQHTKQQEVMSGLDSSMWDHASGGEPSDIVHEGEEDAKHDEESLQSIAEDESMYRQEIKTEPIDRPIRSAASGKTFEEMLEEQLKLENEKSNKSAPADKVKVKRPFLRRGEGLSRFTRGKAAPSSTKPTPCLDPPKPQGPCIRPPQQSLEQKRPPKSTSSTNVVIQRKTAVLNKENVTQNKALVPATKGQAAAKAHVLGAHQGQNMSSGAIQHLSKSEKKPAAQQKNICDAMVHVSKGKLLGRPPDNVDANVQVAENSFEVWEKEQQRECVELGEFELLERAADELSFSSNSSFICALLRKDVRRLSSTPIKSAQESKQPGFRQDSSKIPVQPSVPDLPVDDMRTDDEDKIIEVSDASFCSSTEMPQTDFGPSQPFSHCFQVSQVPPYNKHSYQDKEESASAEEEEIGDSTLVGIQNHVDFDDDDTWNEPDDSNCVSSNVDNPIGRTLKRKVAISKGMDHDSSAVSSLDHETEPPPTCQLVAKLFPALKPKPCPLPPPPAVQDTHSEQGAAQSRLLRERLVELETEIERFKKENATLSRLRQENQEVKENLQKEKAEFQQKMADELAKWEEFKREENRKLQRDKKLFEKHAAALKARPDKQERDEIQSLKQQLNALHEDLRKREARWTSSHHRLRQQVDSLSAENTALRDQVRMMEKLRLTAWKNAENERGRSSVSGSTAAQTRTKSKSPSCSVKSSSGNKRESPELQNPPKAASCSSGARSAACNSKLKNTQNQKESSPVADPISDGRIVPEGRSYEPQSISESFSEEDSLSATEGQSAIEHEITHTEGKIERVLPDGGRLIVFPNGTRKELSADGLSIKITFFNGDIKHIMPDQRVIYYYAGAQTTHTTYPDGMEVLQFPNNQIEKHFPDGRKEITFPDQTVKNLYPDGREESVLADGTIIQQNPDGSKEIQFNTGQRELHTAEFKRREYPDGTVKTVYSDGRQETRYPSGRVRLKDPQGNVVLDSKA